MIIVLSPAKTLDFDQKVPISVDTQPRFIEEASSIMAALLEYDEQALAKLMKISNKLALLNTERHHQWQDVHSFDDSMQAIYAFRGEVYNGLKINQFSEADVMFAQKHVRIMSGLYGVLRPLDLIQPYRLEMGTKINVENFANLYKFWGAKIADTLNMDAQEQGSQVLVNLASKEYFKSILPEALKLKIITPVFKELKGDSYKVIAIYAKKARGLMTAFVIKNRIVDVQNIKHFNQDGYMFDTNQSNDTEWVFTR